MKNRVKSLIESLKTHLFVVMAIIFIVGLAGGFVFFYVSSIDPGFRVRDRLNAQLEDAQKIIRSARRIQEESPQNLQAQLTKARATLSNSTSAFLTPDQASKIIDTLYKNAQASGVTLVDLQVPPTPTPLPTPIPTQTRPATPQPPANPAQTKSASSSSQPPPTLSPTPIQATPTRVATVSAPAQSNLYEVRTLRLRAQGTVQQLVDFGSRFKSMPKGILINSFNISGSDATTSAMLSMDIALYVISGALVETPATK